MCVRFKCYQRLTAFQTLPRVPKWFHLEAQAHNGVSAISDFQAKPDVCRLSHFAHLCYEYDFRATQSSEEMFNERKREFEEMLLAIEEYLIMDLLKIEWKNDDIKHTYEYVDVPAHPNFDVSLGSASARFGPYLKPYPRT